MWNIKIFSALIVLMVCLSFAGCSILMPKVAGGSANSSKNASGTTPNSNQNKSSMSSVSSMQSSLSSQPAGSSSVGSLLNHLSLTVFGNFLKSMNSEESIEFDIENTSNNSSLNGFQIKLPAQYSKDFTLPTAIFEGSANNINGEYVWSFPNQDVAAEQGVTVTITLVPNPVYSDASLPFDFYMSDGTTKICTVNVI